MQQNSDIQEQVRQLVQAAAQGNKEASAQIQQIVSAAEQGDQQAQQILYLIQQEIQAMQMAKRGAKLNYIKSLKGDCPEGEELVYFKKGGMLCKACEKKKQETLKKPNNSIEELKKGKQLKKCQRGAVVVDDKKLKGYSYSADTLKLGPGYQIISQRFHPVYRLNDNNQSNEEIFEDYNAASGRNIYVSPTKSDTVYFDRPIDNITAFEQDLTVPVGRSENQEKSKREFNKKYKQYGPRK